MTDETDREEKNNPKRRKALKSVLASNGDPHKFYGIHKACQVAFNETTKKEYFNLSDYKPVVMLKKESLSLVILIPITGKVGIEGKQGIEIKRVKPEIQ